jgi:hypothetical protein
VARAILLQSAQVWKVGNSERWKDDTEGQGGGIRRSVVEEVASVNHSHARLTALIVHINSTVPANEWEGSDFSHYSECQKILREGR